MKPTLDIKNFDKHIHTSLLNRAKEEKVGHVHIFDTSKCKGGLTVAFRQSGRFKTGRMVDVAVATCSIEDTFSRKIGANIALRNFFEGNTISLPLLLGYDVSNINYAVKAAFTRLYLDQF